MNVMDIGEDVCFTSKSNINAISHAEITHAAINQKKEEDMIGKGFI